MDINKIKNAAIDFRQAIEACAPSLGVSFENFPSGSCGDVSPMLGTYLLEQNLGQFQYLLGTYGNHEDNTWSSHGWLQIDDLVVDITADQFSEILDKVIVKHKSAWHKKLKGHIQNVGDYRAYDIQTVSNLDRVYKRIVAFISKT